MYYWIFYIESLDLRGLPSQILYYTKSLRTSQPPTLPNILFFVLSVYKGILSETTREFYLSSQGISFWDYKGILSNKDKGNLSYWKSTGGFFQGNARRGMKEPRHICICSRPSQGFALFPFPSTFDLQRLMGSYLLWCQGSYQGQFSRLSTGLGKCAHLLKNCAWGKFIQMIVEALLCWHRKPIEWPRLLAPSIKTCLLMPLSTTSRIFCELGDLEVVPGIRHKNRSDDWHAA